jgi:hypothetical protein
MGSAPHVRAHLASLDTSAATELCLRTLRGRAGVDELAITVGDCGSTDGSLDMLDEFVLAGVIRLEVAADGRRHAEWLDHWYASCDARWCLFSDSDVEYRRDGWLRDMLDAGERAGAAVVATRIQARDGVPYEHPVTGARRTLAARPEPWLLLLDVDVLRPVVSTSFAYRDEEQPDGTKIAYDVGAAFYRDVVAAGLTVVEMPAPFAQAYRHYGGLSWQRGSGLPWHRVLKQSAKRAWVRAQLELARRRYPLPRTAARS